MKRLIVAIIVILIISGNKSCFCRDVDLYGYGGKGKVLPPLGSVNIFGPGVSSNQNLYTLEISNGINVLSLAGSNNNGKRFSYGSLKVPLKTIQGDDTLKFQQFFKQQLFSLLNLYKTRETGKGVIIKKRENTYVVIPEGESIPSNMNVRGVFNKYSEKRKKVFGRDFQTRFIYGSNNYDLKGSQKVISVAPLISRISVRSISEVKLRRHQVQVNNKFFTHRGIIRSRVSVNSITLMEEGIAQPQMDNTSFIQEEFRNMLVEYRRNLSHLNLPHLEIEKTRRESSSTSSVLGTFYFQNDSYLADVKLSGMDLSDYYLGLLVGNNIFNALQIRFKDLSRLGRLTDYTGWEQFWDLYSPQAIIREILKKLNPRKLTRQSAKFKLIFPEEISPIQLMVILLSIIVFALALGYSATRYHLSRRKQFLTIPISR
ncbi:MAG: hypothetical protein J7J54_06915 [Candidatus Omnitrophica bacterium]|nr:hypothetical protein [Candidatus Omnitrophota bacterium]